MLVYPVDRRKSVDMRQSNTQRANRCVSDIACVLRIVGNCTWPPENIERGFQFRGYLHASFHHTQWECLVVRFPSIFCTWQEMTWSIVHLTKDKGTISYDSTSRRWWLGWWNEMSLAGIVISDGIWKFVAANNLRECCKMNRWAVLLQNEGRWDIRHVWCTLVIRRWQ